VLKIDIHNHVIPQASMDLMVRERVYGIHLENGWVSGAHTSGLRWTPAYFDPEGKLAELEKHGLEAAVLSGAPNLFYYELAPEPAEMICAATNRGLAQLCAAKPDRLWWLAMLPMQLPERAPQVLEESHAAGAVGVHIGTSVCGRPIDAPDYEPFWAAAERLDMVVMVHPAYNASHPALGDWYLGNTIGNLLETTVMLERLICSGVLDRHPKVRVLAVHGGGAFPYTAGRLRHARSIRPELNGTPENPWAYVGQVVFDTITHDVAALSYLVARAGHANVMLGTDLPFDMATQDPVGELEKASGDIHLAELVGGNAQRIFKLAS
jgi:aminocarboxymuconate-semialdehyde decarboxylase